MRDKGGGRRRGARTPSVTDFSPSTTSMHAISSAKKRSHDGGEGDFSAGPPGVLLPVGADVTLPTSSVARLSSFASIDGDSAEGVRCRSARRLPGGRGGGSRAQTNGKRTSLDTTRGWHGRHGTTPRSAEPAFGRLDQI